MRSIAQSLPRSLSAEQPSVESTQFQRLSAQEPAVQQPSAVSDLAALNRPNILVIMADDVGYWNVGA